MDIEDNIQRQVRKETARQKELKKQIAQLRENIKYEDSLRAKAEQKINEMLDKAKHRVGV